MSEFDRSKVRGAKIAANKGAQEEAKKFQKQTGGFLGYHTIEEGKNVFRLMPPHPDCAIGASYLPVRTTQLNCEVKERDKDGNETGKTEIKAKKIFSAKMHGSLPDDPIELYIEYVYKKANEEIDDKEERKKMLRPISGWRGKDGWHWGISMRTSFLTYAVANGELKKLELYDSMVKDMNKLCVAEDEEDVIETDPFSDPDEGYPLVITKEKNSKGGWEYTVAKDTLSKKLKEDWEMFFERTRVTDEQLIELCKQKPLSEIVGPNVYTRRDWDFALDGLRRFDLDNGNPDKIYRSYGIFENEEFLEELGELELLVPEYRSEEKSTEPKEESGDEDDDDTKAEEENEEVSPTEMRMMLRKAVKKQFGEEYQNQVPTNVAELQKAYAKFVEDDDLSFVVLKGKAAETKSDEAENLSSETQKRLELIRKKRQNS